MLLTTDIINEKMRKMKETERKFVTSTSGTVADMGLKVINPVILQLRL